MVVSSRIRRLVCAVIAIVAIVGAIVEGQRRRGGGWEYRIEPPGPTTNDGRFQFCRIMFRSSRYGDGGGWGVDFPRGDINISIRFSELTKAPVSFDRNKEPNYFVVRLTDPQMFQCPFVMLTEVGTAYFDEEEAAALRTYVEKGGFVWADDFWGERAWEFWEEQLRKALPRHEFPIVDLPKDHALFRAQFVMTKTPPQIASINHWYNTGGTSERGAESAVPHARAILDKEGRIMVLMTHNTDIGDSWEREADDPTYFYNFSVDGYAFGINVLIYTMTH
jgi:hypothetical protein